VRGTPLLGMAVIVKDIVYTSRGTKVQNVYRDDRRLVVRRGAVFPDICISCGRPAWGNVERREFIGNSVWLFVLPPGPDMVANSIFGKRYHFDFPFCSSCPPGNLQVMDVRLDAHLAVFIAHLNEFPGTFMDAIPSVPSDVAREMNRPWLQRTFH
jgi:hypothetical protein